MRKESLWTLNTVLDGAARFFAFTAYAAGATEIVSIALAVIGAVTGCLSWITMCIAALISAGVAVCSVIFVFAILEAIRAIADIAMALETHSLNSILFIKDWADARTSSIVVAAIIITASGFASTWIGAWGLIAAIPCAAWALFVLMARRTVVLWLKESGLNEIEAERMSPLFDR